MSSVRDIVKRAKQAYRACAHVEEEWLTNELGDDLDIIQDALGDIMYPEQFATPWEKKLSETLDILFDSAVDTGLDIDPETGNPDEFFEKTYTLLKNFSKEQERRLEARIQMEAYSTSKQAEKP